MGFGNAAQARAFITDIIGQLDPFYADKINSEGIAVESEITSSDFSNWCENDDWVIRVDMITGNDILILSDGSVGIEVSSEDGRPGFVRMPEMSASGISWRFRQGLVNELRDALIGLEDVTPSTTITHFYLPDTTYEAAFIPNEAIRLFDSALHFVSQNVAPDELTDEVKEMIGNLINEEVKAARHKFDRLTGILNPFILVYLDVAEGSVVAVREDTDGDGTEDKIVRIEWAQEANPDTGLHLIYDRPNCAVTED